MTSLQRWEYDANLDGPLGAVRRTLTVDGGDKEVQAIFADATEKLMQLAPLVADGKP